MDINKTRRNKQNAWLREMVGPWRKVKLSGTDVSCDLLRRVMRHWRRDATRLRIHLFSWLPLDLFAHFTLAAATITT